MSYELLGDTWADEAEYEETQRKWDQDRIQRVIADARDDVRSAIKVLRARRERLRIVKPLLPFLGWEALEAHQRSVAWTRNKWAAYRSVHAFYIA